MRTNKTTNPRLARLLRDANGSQDDHDRQRVVKSCPRCGRYGQTTSQAVKQTYQLSAIHCGLIPALHSCSEGATSYFGVSVICFCEGFKTRRCLKGNCPPRHMSGLEADSKSTYRPVRIVSTADPICFRSWGLLV